MDSSFLKTGNGTELHFLQSTKSNGPLLICLHGLGGSTRTFEPLVARLPKSYSAVLVDFPGFGKSPAPSVRPTIARYVADLHDLVSYLQVNAAQKTQKLYIVGHSLGTAVALHYAAQRPRIVTGIILIGPARSISHIPAAQKRMRDMAMNTRKNGISWAADLGAKSNLPPDNTAELYEKIRKEVYNAIVASDVESYAVTCEMMADESHQDPDYGAVVCPTLLIAGEFDVISPVQRSQDLLRLLGSPQCRLEQLQTGHQHILENTDAVAATIEDFLKQTGI